MLKRISKGVSSLFLALCLLTLSFTPFTAYAAQNDSENQMIYKSYTINDDGTFVEKPNVQIPRTSKQQEKYVVSKATGEIVGIVILYYNTRIEGGRPVFVDDVTIGAEFYDMYRGSWKITNPNIRDYIILQVDYSNIIDSGYDIIKFYPN